MTKVTVVNKTMSDIGSNVPLLNGWRSLNGGSRRMRALRADARRCLRLAQSAVSSELADELEAIGRDFDREAERLNARMQSTVYQICYPGFARQGEPKSLDFARSKFV